MIAPLDFSHWQALRQAARDSGLSRLNLRRDWLVALLVGRCYLDVHELKALRVHQLDLYGRATIKPILKPFRLALTQTLRPRRVLLDAESYFTGRAYAQSLRRAGKRLHPQEGAIRACRRPFSRATSRTLQHGFAQLAQAAGLEWSLTELRTRALASLALHGDAVSFMAISGLDVRMYYRYLRRVNSRT